MSETNDVNAVVILPKPENGERVETGAIQFGDDWPGVFIRGDNAAYWAMALNDVILYSDGDPLTVEAVKGLRDLLMSSRAT